MQSPADDAPHTLDFVRRWFGRRKLRKTRLSPLKVLLYLESTERKRRATSPERLKREIGVGGYNTITDSFLWLVSHQYIAPAPGTLATLPSQMLDSTEFIVTPLGKEVLKPYLNTFGIHAVMELGLLTALVFVLGGVFVLYQLYPGFLWFEEIIGVMAAAMITPPLLMTARVATKERKNRVAELMNSVTDRD
jgi:hypothetical protein